MNAHESPDTPTTCDTADHRDCRRGVIGTLFAKAFALILGGSLLWFDSIEVAFVCFGAAFLFLALAAFLWREEA